MLSAIVVNYRSAADTAACVASLLADDPAIEVVVVDNSADSTHTAQLKAQLPAPAKLHVSESNQGFGAACNLGWTMSSGDEVMLLNPDARVMVGALRALQCVLRNARQRQDRLAAVSPLQVWDEEGQWLLPPAWLPTGIGLWALRQASGSTRQAQRLSWAYRQLALPVWRAAMGLSDANQVIPQRALSGGAMMVRRDAIEDLNMLFDERYFMYYEDADLCLRLRQRRWHLGLVPSAVATHAWVHSEDKVEMMERAKHQYIERHFEGKGQWAERLQRAKSLTALDVPLVEARLQANMTWPVPDEMQRGWVLEVSPSPLLVPAIAHVGQGPLARLPAALRLRMGPGPVFGRVTKFT